MASYVISKTTLHIRNNQIPFWRTTKTTRQSFTGAYMQGEWEFATAMCPSATYRKAPIEEINIHRSSPRPASAQRAHLSDPSPDRLSIPRLPSG
jgi:hypothetical protein